MQGERWYPLLFMGGMALMLCLPHSLWSNYYGAVFALVVSILVFQSKTVSPLRGILPAAVGVFLLMCFLSALWSAYPRDCLRTAVFYASGALLGLAAASWFRQEENTNALFGSIYISLLICSLYGLVRYFLGGDDYYTEISGSSVPRLSSTLENPINFGEFVAMAFPLSWTWAKGERDPRRRRTLLALLAPGLIALAFTYSRTGYLALGFALFLLWRLWKRPVYLLCAAVLVLPVLPDRVRERLLSPFIFTDSSSSGRFTLWRECLNMLRFVYPLGVGLGSENFFNAYLPYSTGTLPFSPPHANMGYLDIFLSTGIVGFVSFLIFFFGIFFRLHRAIRTAPEPQRRLLRALEASLAGAALANVPEQIWFYPRIGFFWWILYGLAIALT